MKEMQRAAKTFCDIYFFVELDRLNLFRINDDHQFFLKEYNNFL